MTDRTETIVSRSCGVVALALVGLVLFAPPETVGGGMPKLSARMLWPMAKGRQSTARPATATKGQEQGGAVIFAPTPAFRAQQARQQAIRDKWAKRIGEK